MTLSNEIGSPSRVTLEFWSGVLPITSNCRASSLLRIRNRVRDAHGHGSDGRSTNSRITMLHSIVTMRTLLIVSAVSLLAALAAAQPHLQLNLMPMPSVVQPETGQLAIDR